MEEEPVIVVEEACEFRDCILQQNSSCAKASALHLSTFGDQHSALLGFARPALSVLARFSFSNQSSRGVLLC